MQQCHPIEGLGITQLRNLLTNRYKCKHVYNYLTIFDLKMGKQPISIQDVIQELRDLFRVTNRGFSSEIDGIFFIDKRQYSASEVHMKLEMYFNDKYIINGLCKIYPNCVTYTRFEIKSIDKLIPNYRLMGGYTPEKED